MSPPARTAKQNLPAPLGPIALVFMSWQRSRARFRPRRALRPATYSSPPAFFRSVLIAACISRMTAVDGRARPLDSDRCILPASRPSPAGCLREPRYRARGRRVCPRGCVRSGSQILLRREVALIENDTRSSAVEDARRSHVLVGVIQRCSATADEVAGRWHASRERSALARPPIRRRRGGDHSREAIDGRCARSPPGS